MPDNLKNFETNGNSSGGMGFGRETSGVRPLVKAGAHTSVELMAGSGLKYIHAFNAGFFLFIYYLFIIFIYLFFFKVLVVCI
jgi:hypothetical protein